MVDFKKPIMTVSMLREIKIYSELEVNWSCSSADCLLCPWQNSYISQLTSKAASIKIACALFYEKCKDS